MLALFDARLQFEFIPRLDSQVIADFNWKSRLPLGGEFDRGHHEN
jgi:hypothetical protein